MTEYQILYTLAIMSGFISTAALIFWAVTTFKTDEIEINQTFDKLNDMIEELCPASHTWSEVTTTTTTTYKRPPKKFQRKPRYMGKRK